MNKEVKMKIGVISDLHLGHRQYGLREREFDFYEQLQKCVTKLNKHHCKIVIIAGDIFDKPNPSPEAIHKYIDIVGKLKCNTIVAIKGNHTMLLRDDHYAVDELVAEEIDNYILLEDKNWTQNEISIDGITYRGPTELDKLIKIQKKMASNIDEDESFNILVVHQAFKEFCGFTNEELSIKDFDYTPYNVIICGHIHSRKHTFLDENTIFLQPGSIERLNTEEARDEQKNGKGVYIIDTKKQICDFHPIKCEREFYLGKVCLNTSSDIKEHFEHLQESIDERKELPIISYKYDIPEDCYTELHDSIPSIKNILMNNSKIQRNLDDDPTTIITESEVPPPSKAVKIVAEQKYEKNKAELSVDIFNNCESQENLKKIIDDYFEKNYNNDIDNNEFDEHQFDELYAYFENLEV